MASTGYIMLRGVRRMRESNAYKQILEEGEAIRIPKGVTIGKLEGERRMLLLAGVRRLGVAPPAVAARVETIESLDLLESLMVRIFDVETWDDLLAGVA